jgi:DNA-binding response OmpR family regulator
VEVIVVAAPKILCVEQDAAVRESRCAVLNVSGYDAASATPHLAEVVLRSQKFDLLVLSTLNDSLIGFADDADVLVLDDGLTMPSELLWLVEERLNRQQRT